MSYYILIKFYGKSMVPIFRLHSCRRIQNFISFAEESYGIISFGTYVTLAQNCIVEALKQS
jgi:hypothetical protein